MRGKRQSGPLKRPGQSREDAFESLIEGDLGAAPSPEDIPERAARWLLTARESARHGSARITAAQLIAAVERVARKHNIDLQRFYPALVEKMLLQGEEGSRSAVKPSTKERILDAALDVFSEKGFHSTTVDEIAELAGVGKGTLYRYFANKETLFNELVRLRLEELEAEAGKALDGHDDVLTMISKVVRVYFEFFDRNQRLYHLIAQERLEVGEQVQDLYFKKALRRIPLLKRKIHEATQQGRLKDVDFQTVFYGVMGFIHGVIQKWLAKDCSYPLMDESPTVLEVLFYGFVKRPNVENT